MSMVPNTHDSCFQRNIRAIAKIEKCGKESAPSPTESSNRLAPITENRHNAVVPEAEPSGVIPTILFNSQTEKIHRDSCGTSPMPTIPRFCAPQNIRNCVVAQPEPMVTDEDCITID